MRYMKTSQICCMQHLLHGHRALDLSSHSEIDLSLVALCRFWVVGFLGWGVSAIPEQNKEEV